MERKEKTFYLQSPGLDSISGPFNSRDILSAIESGGIKGSDFLRRSNSKNWHRVDEVKELTPLLLKQKTSSFLPEEVIPVEESGCTSTALERSTETETVTESESEADASSLIGVLVVVGLICLLIGIVVAINSYSWESIGKWFAGWFVPGIALAIWIASDKAKKGKIEHFDSGGKALGHSEYETGEIEKGDPELGFYAFMFWIIAYPLFWIFYGWWVDFSIG